MLATVQRAVPKMAYSAMFEPKAHHIPVSFRGEECFVVPNGDCGSFADRLNIFYTYEDRGRGG